MRGYKANLTAAEVRNLVEETRRKKRESLNQAHFRLTQDPPLVDVNYDYLLEPHSLAEAQEQAKKNLHLK